MKQVIAQALPDQPNVFGELTLDPSGRPFRQRWLPGAFGDRESIEDVIRFRVLEDRWERADGGRVLRTIIRAEWLGTVDSGTAAPASAAGGAA